MKSASSILFYLLFSMLIVSCASDHERKADLNYKIWPDSLTTRLNQHCQEEAIAMSLSENESQLLCNCTIDKIVKTYPIQNLNRHINQLERYYDHAKLDCIIELNFKDRFTSFCLRMDLDRFNFCVSEINNVLFTLKNKGSKDELNYWRKRLNIPIKHSEGISADFYSKNAFGVEEHFKKELIEGANLIFNDSTQTKINEEGLNLIENWNIWWSNKKTLLVSP